MSASPYPIVDVSAVTSERPEQMGSRQKFWFTRRESAEPQPVGVEWLFKVSRPDRGEDWAEKVAAEIAAALDVPHAVVEMATRHGRCGSIARRFDAKDRPLVHGNELLARVIDTYPKEVKRSKEHRLDDVLNALDQLAVGVPSSMKALTGVDSGSGAFVGFLMLDALIGNTDRHHENWGALRSPGRAGSDEELELAPTFDHASSLGRDLALDRMAARLRGLDPRFTVGRYAERARSKFHGLDGAVMSTLEAFAHAAARLPTAATAWQGRLAALEPDTLSKLVQRVPEQRLPPIGVQFVSELLRFNRTRILDVASRP